MAIPHTNPAPWPEIRPGRLASSIVTSSPEGCGVALLGVPDDLGVSLNNGRVGAQGGPRVFREALARYGMPFHQPESRDLSVVRIFDAGDLDVSEELETTHDRLTEAVRAILDAGMFPIVIGGGHDLTWPGVRALGAFLDATFDGVYLDAHLDVREERGSGMPFRKILTETSCALLQVVGLDPFANSAEHIGWFEANRGRIAGREEDANTVFARCESEHAFVSIDLDVINAALAPGVSSANPVGLLPHEVDEWAFRAARDPRVKYLDLMEFNPAYDADGRTARLAARLFLSIIAGFAGRGDSIR